MQPDQATTTETAQVDAPMAEGVLVGGWGYIWAAYGVTWTGLVAYTAYVIIRRSLQRASRPTT